MEHFEMEPFIRDLQSIKDVEADFSLPRWAYILIAYLSAALVLGLTVLFWWCKRKPRSARTRRKISGERGDVAGHGKVSTPVEGATTASRDIPSAPLLEVMIASKSEPVHAG